MLKAQTAEALDDLLGQMQSAVTGDDDAVPPALQGRLLAGPVGGFGIGERLAIYRNAYRMRLVAALRETFGHCAVYLDAQFDGKGQPAFDRLALAFVQSHPSTHRNINQYDAAWPAWLAGQLPQWPELADLAALDWQLRRAFDGPDAPALGLAGLADHLGQEGGEWRPMRPVPTFARLRFSTNALALWHAIDNDVPPPAAERLPSPMELMVWRVGERPHFRSLERFEALALDALCTRASFGGMCEHLSRLPEQEMPDELAAATGALLRRWIDESLLRAGVETAANG